MPVEIPAAEAETRRYFLNQEPRFEDERHTPFRSYLPGDTIVNARFDAGDLIVVNKMAYHFRKPERGEVFVFDTRGIEGIAGIADFANDLGINLCMEVLNRFENHVLNTAAEGVAFVKEVGKPNVKVMLDTFHMNIEEDSIGGAIRTAGSLLGHLHTGECNRRVPGKGRTRLSSCCTAARAWINFGRFMSVTPRSWPTRAAPWSAAVATNGSCGTRTSTTTPTASASAVAASLHSSD